MFSNNVITTNRMKITQYIKIHYTMANLTKSNYMKPKSCADFGLLFSTLHELFLYYLF